MSTITDQLIDNNLPDKASGKYKPKRLRTLLKELVNQILSEAVGKKMYRTDSLLAITSEYPQRIAMIAGGNVALKKVLLVMKDYNGNPIPEGDLITVTCGNVQLYSGPVVPAISIPCDNKPTFAELDLIVVLFEGTSATQYAFHGAVITEEL